MGVARCTFTGSWRRSESLELELVTIGFTGRPRFHGLAIYAIVMITCGRMRPRILANSFRLKVIVRTASRSNSFGERVCLAELLLSDHLLLRPLT